MSTPASSRMVFASPSPRCCAPAPPASTTCISFPTPWRGSPLVGAAFAPHAPYTVSDAPLERIAMYSSELDLPVHMHVHEKLASGFCPLARLQQAGVTVALGTDGAASNNDLDLFGEMRSAALLAKGVSNDASACNAEQAIRMATIDGARALGLDRHIGSIEEGKQADLIAIDFAHLDSQPLYNPVSQLVYALNSRQVSDVWVAGRRQLAAGRFTDIDPDRLIHQARQWQQRIGNS